MSDNEKCQNEGCGAWKDYLLGNCSRHIEKYIKTCPKYTTTPTTSILVAEIEELRKANTLLEGYVELSQAQNKDIQTLCDKIKELEADADRPFPLPVVGELEKILGYRAGPCTGCGWHPDVCKHCVGSLNQ